MSWISQEKKTKNRKEKSYRKELEHKSNLQRTFIDRDAVILIISFYFYRFNEKEKNIRNSSS